MRLWRQRQIEGINGIGMRLRRLVALLAGFSTPQTRGTVHGAQTDTSWAQ